MLSKSDIMKIADLHESMKSLAEEVAEWRRWWDRPTEDGKAWPDAAPNTAVRLARRVTDTDPIAASVLQDAMEHPHAK